VVHRRHYMARARAMRPRPDTVTSRCRSSSPVTILDINYSEFIRVMVGVTLFYLLSRSASLFNHLSSSSHLNPFEFQFARPVPPLACLAVLCG